MAATGGEKAETLGEVCWDGWAAGRRTKLAKPGVRGRDGGLPSSCDGRPGNDTCRDATGIETGSMGLGVSRRKSDGPVNVCESLTRDSQEDDQTLPHLNGRREEVDDPRQPVAIGILMMGV